MCHNILTVHRMSPANILSIIHQVFILSYFVSALVTVASPSTDAYETRPGTGSHSGEAHNLFFDLLQRLNGKGGRVYHMPLNE